MLTTSCERAVRYVTRSVPALALFALATLLHLSFRVDSSTVLQHGAGGVRATNFQVLLCLHILLLHIASLFFTARAFGALKHLMTRIQETATTHKDYKALAGLHRSLRFAIIIPSYKEEEETLRRTLNILASHPQARFMYHVYLGMEGREEGSEAKAKSLIKNFRYRFYDMTFSVHPGGLPNDVPGKSSNESWVAQQISKDYPPAPQRPDVIVTTMDSDTYLSSRYFAQIMQLYTAATPERQKSTMYVPPLVFDRNFDQIPMPVRLADMLWANAGMSNMYAGSTVTIPTSVYSLSLDLIEHVGGWDTDSGAIGEDMHMFLKCFFFLSGNLHVEVIYAPASSCDIHTGLTGIRGYLSCMWARQEQATRHMWGALDTGFAIRAAFTMLRRRWRSMTKLEDYVDTTISPCCGKDLEGIPLEGTHKIQVRKVLTVFHRLFEAHFIPVQLSLVLTVSSYYSMLYPSFLLPDALRNTLDFCSMCRLVSYALMLCTFYRYEQYHHLCVGLRKEEMRKANLLEEMLAANEFSANVFLRGGFLEATTFPISGLIFGSVPALYATIMHLFTERIIYKVSLKPSAMATRPASLEKEGTLEKITASEASDWEGISSSDSSGLV